MKKYNIIYADPPWQYQDKSLAGNRGACCKYPVMTIENIKILPIQELSADNCILFLWVTFPLLQEGLDTIKAWGFKYKTIGFNWVKRTTKSGVWFWGMGNWTRSNSEICLIGIKGKPQRISKSIHSIIDTPIEQHSKKPDIIRDKIIELCGDLPRVELFARQKHDGWDSWGNEIESDFIMPENNQTGVK